MRRSIQIAGFSHKNPVPAACAKGGFVISGGISGMDPETGELPSGLDAQCRNIFRHFRAVMAAAGGDVADIVKVTVWLKGQDREPLNREWVAMFPDPACRPTRHVHPADFSPEIDPSVQIVCDLTAVLEPSRRAEA